MIRHIAPFLRWSGIWHGLAVALVLFRPDLWRLSLTALVLNHVVITAACVWPRSRLLGPNVRRLPAPYAARRQVALTFDDGPDPSVTPRVADILERHSATATFFCIGRLVEQHPLTVRDLLERGHSVESHTYRHLLGFAFLGPWRTAREIDDAQEAITRATGVAPRYVRAPAGIRAPWTQAILERRGLRLVSWTRRGFDTVTRDPDRVVRRLTKGLQGGEILLVHDVATARDAAGEPLVLTALPRLLDQLAAAGLQAVALPRELAR